MLTLAFAALALLLLSWVGYPLIMAVMARSGRTAVGSGSSDLPSVAVIIATRDTPETISRRVDDIRRAQYPPTRLQVIVAIDARSTYSTADQGRRLGDRSLVVAGDKPGGKAAALNAGVRAATADILVFADSHQSFAPDAISQLVRFLDDPRYGAVSGAVVQNSGDRWMDFYWKYELLIRRGQSAAHSLVGTSGAIQAVRRALWQPLPSELICDDLYITLKLVQRGYRVGFVPSARAIDQRRFTKRQHLERKVRTLTGVFQLITWMPAVLVPWRNPIWIHFVCHKLMRLVTPYLAILVALGAAAGLIQVLGATLWIPLGIITATLGAVVAARPAWGRRLGAQAGWLLLLLVVPIVATLNGLQKRWQVWHAYQHLEDG